MTRTNSTVSQRFNANGVTTDFAISFDFQDTDEITVSTIDETDINNPIEVSKVITTDYTLTGGPPVTTVHFLVAPTSGLIVFLERSTAFTQETDYLDNSSIPSESFENGLDKLTQLVQEISARLDAVIASIGSTDFDSVSNLPTLSLSRGGTSAALAAVLGGIPYSTASALAILAAGSANQVIASGGAAAPSWTWGALPQVFGSYASPRSIIAATGIASASSHMSTTAYEQIVFAQASSANGNVSAGTQITAGTVVGQRMWIIGASDTTPFTLNNGSGLALKGNAIMGDRCVLSLVWDGTVWSEMFRNF